MLSPGNTGHYMTCSPLSHQQLLIVQGHAQSFGVVVKSCMVCIWRRNVNCLSMGRAEQYEAALTQFLNTRYIV